MQTQNHTIQIVDGNSDIETRQRHKSLDIPTQRIKDALSVRMDKTQSRKQSTRRIQNEQINNQTNKQTTKKQNKQNTASIFSHSLILKNLKK
jgi:hypothetical protein